MTATVLNAFIADEVRVEENGKINALGIYFEVNARTTQPRDMSRATLFMMLTDVAAGDHEVILNVADHTGKRAISSVAARLKDADPDQVYQIIVEMDGFNFPNSGLYTMALKIKDEILFSSQLSVEYPAGKTGKA